MSENAPLYTPPSANELADNLDYQNLRNPLEQGKIRGVLSKMIAEEKQRRGGKLPASEAQIAMAVGNLHIFTRLPEFITFLEQGGLKISPKTKLEYFFKQLNTTGVYVGKLTDERSHKVPIILLKTPTKENLWHELSHAADDIANLVEQTDVHSGVIAQTRLQLAVAVTGAAATGTTLITAIGAKTPEQLTAQNGLLAVACVSSALALTEYQKYRSRASEKKARQAS